MMEYSPCKDCPDRHTACHDSCDKYKDWKVRYQAQQKHLNDNKYRMLVPMSEAREKKRTHYTKHPMPGSKGGIQ